MSEEQKCPFSGKKMPVAGKGTTNKDWWPNQVNLGILHQHAPSSNPMDKDFNYAEEFKKIGSAAGYYDDYHEGKDPAGISTQDPELAARLDPVEG